MSLIKCKECNNEISDKATTCPHCGCPVEKTILCPYCDIDSGKTFKEIQDLGHKIECKNCGKTIRVLTKEQDKLYIASLKNEPNIPKCITCGSTNIQKISTGSKVMGAAMFGLFSKTAKSQFKCNDCGCKW